jgi:hypothetical protein
MVTYEKGGDRFKKDGYDDREPGLGWEECKSEICYAKHVSYTLFGILCQEISMFVCFVTET